MQQSFWPQPGTAGSIINVNYVRSVYNYQIADGLGYVSSSNLNS
jgi:hypothetical protein